MARFSNILVYLPLGVDGAEVLQRAIPLLGAKGRMVIADVGRAFPKAHRVYKSVDLQGLDTDQRTRRLDRLVEEFSKKGVKLQTQVLRGSPSEALIDLVERAKHDLLITPARESGDDPDGSVKTTAMRLFRRCPCPVWAVDASQPPKVRKVAIAIADPAEEGHEGLTGRLIEVGRTLEETLGCELHAVHAWRAYGEPLLRAEMGDTELMTYVQEVQKSIEHRLKPLVGAMKLDLVMGAPEVSVPRYLKEQQVDLLLIGTLARKGIKGFLIGNTSEHLLQVARCSILVVRPA